MIYLPEHTVDLETGAIVQAQVRPGDQRDSVDLSERVIEAALNINRPTQPMNQRKQRMGLPCRIMPDSLPPK